MNTIELLVDHDRNRQLLAEWLGEIYHVQTEGVAEDGGTPFATADLCLVDVRAFTQNQETLRAWKNETEPVFAPVLLVSEEDLTEEFEPSDWETIDGLYVVDEVVTMPIEKAVLHRRLENLLERRRLSDQLTTRYEQAEERFSSLFNGTPDPALVLEDGTVAAANDAFCRLFSVERAAVVDAPLASVPSMSESTTATIADLASAAASGVDVVPETVRVDGTGSGDRYLEATVNTIAYDGREGVVVVMRDVTERRSRERELAANERRFRAVFENANDALVIADDDGTCVDANSAACELFGVAESALLGRSIDEFAAEQAAVGAKWDRFLESGDMSGEFELRLRGKDRVLEFTATTNVTPGRHLVALRDVTARREMEAKLRRREARFSQIATNVDEVIWMADGDAADLLYLSPSYDDLVGESTPPIEDLTLFDHLQHVHPADRETVRMYLETLLADSAAGEFDEEYSVSYRIKRCDGDVRWVEASSYPVIDDGELIRFVGLIDDITDRKRREDQLARQNERLEEFAGIVSHDLRNPLQVVSARATLLADDYPDDENVDAIRDATERMVELIEDLLTLAREGDPLDDIEPTDLETVAREAWKSIDAPAATLTVDTPGTIEADRSRLRQLLENLFRNAIDHGDPAVEVRVAALPDGDSPGFFVSDDGPGIAAAERDQIFESGYTTDPTGTGLGLSIVSEIAGAHGWTVDVSESDAGGAQFEFRDVTYVDAVAQ